MKTQTIRRLLLTVAAGAMLVGPLSTLSATAQEGRRDDRPQQAQDNDRHDNYDRHGNKRWRDDRRDARWDDSQHNGYYDRSRWHAGPPPPTSLAISLGSAANTSVITTPAMSKWITGASIYALHSVVITGCAMTAAIISSPPSQPA